MKNIILIPTDFSKVCTEAVHYGAQLAKRENTSIAIVHIVNKESVSKLENKNNPDEQIQKNLEELANQVKNKYNIEVQTIFRKGSIYTTINEISVEIGAKLIVLGTHGKVGVKQQLTGSFAHKVVSSSDVPVIILPEGVDFKDGIQKIVFPISSTANVRQKVGWAVQIAKIFNAKIYLFKFYETLEETRLKLNVVVNQIIDEFDRNDVDYEIQNAEKGGNYGNQVLLFSKTIHSELIMIMSSPDKLNYMFSSYDEQIMFNDNHIPTMLINPRELLTYHWY
ncbi:MAG: universal stress protein [Bacteroidetes bacterium]|nr:universal stress protein [Bacteroidota bacterium]